MTETGQKDKLWTSSFISICIGNFLLFFAFYLLLPILPLYLIEEFNSNKTTIGLILGGKIGDTQGGLSLSYFIGGLIAIISFVYFLKIAGPHFEKNKLY